MRHEFVGQTQLSNKSGNFHIARKPMMIELLKDSVTDFKSACETTEVGVSLDHDYGIAATCEFPSGAQTRKSAADNRYFVFLGNQRAFFLATIANSSSGTSLAWAKSYPCWRMRFRTSPSKSCCSCGPRNVSAPWYSGPLRVGVYFITAKSASSTPTGKNRMVRPA